MKLLIFTVSLNDKPIEAIINNTLPKEALGYRNRSELEIMQNIAKFGYYDDITKTFFPGHSISRIQIIEE